MEIPLWCLSLPRRCFMHSSIPHSHSFMIWLCAKSLDSGNFWNDINKRLCEHKQLTHARSRLSCWIRELQYLIPRCICFLSTKMEKQSWELSKRLLYFYVRMIRRGILLSAVDFQIASDNSTRYFSIHSSKRCARSLISTLKPIQAIALAASWNDPTDRKVNFREWRSQRIHPRLRGEFSSTPFGTSALYCREINAEINK